MIYAKQPTPERLQGPQRMLRQEVGQVSQRVHMVLFSWERRNVLEIIQLFRT
jgi:hypothetical protein